METKKMENNPAQKEGEENKTKKSWKKYFYLAILTLIAVFGYLFYRFTQKPAEGVVKTGVSQNEMEKKVQSVPEVFSGKYLTFMYENKYFLKTHDDKADESGIILERAYLSENGSISKKIQLTIRSLPSHNLDDCPDYKMRELDTARYKKEIFSQGEFSSTAFVPADDSQFTKTFFLTHGDYLAIVVFTAPAVMDDELNEEADGVAASVNWLK